jgi:hypothetical protein
MTRHPRNAAGWPAGVAVLTVAGTWLVGLALSGNLALPVWALPAGVGVLATVCGWLYALIRLSHGGPWGWTSLQRRHRPTHTGHRSPVLVNPDRVRTTTMRDEDR